MISLTRDTKILFLIFASALFLYMQGLSFHGIEYRDDEIFYYKSTQEMFQDKNFLSPTYFGENRFQKPILYYWFILFCYSFFGVNWFAARIISVILASLSICLTWKIGKKFFDERTAFLSSVILMTIPLFFRHAKNAVPDMSLNFFIVWAIYSAICFNESPDKKQHRYSFFLACSLGFMIKGFAAIIVPFVTLMCFALFSKRGELLKQIQFPVGMCICAAVILPWFLYMSFFHGDAYTQYMLVHETQNRIVSEGNAPLLVKMMTSFGRNLLFYLNVILNYFAPWCAFLLGAIPYAFWRLKKNDDIAASLSWMLIWFFVVFLFFSLIHVTINHYVLVLSTPFAILISFFFSEGCLKLGRKFIFIKAFIAIVLSLSFLALVFLHLMLAQGSLLWILLYVPAYIIIMQIIKSSKNTTTAPLILALFMIFTLCQNKMIVNSGVAAHSALQRFAKTIIYEMDKNAMIGVGSHDLHEKEFQVYFEKKLKKVANSSDKRTRELIKGLFVNNEEVYCLIIERDYNKYKKALESFNPIVIQEEYIFRKRLRLDGKFVLAIVRLDRGLIHHYLMEKVLLIRKDKNA